MTDLPPRTGDDAGDALLLERVRAGDSDAFAVLYEQEVDAARRLARILVGEERAEELVAESFARVLAQLKAGRGPTEDFRAYLQVTIRNGFRDGLRAPKEAPSSDQPWLLDDVLPPVEELVADLDRDVAVSALATLPKSWQQVLWHLEVEGRKPAEVATLLDMEAGTVSSLAYRAREGLKRAYLDQHLEPASGGLCGWTQSRMSQYVRGDLSARAEAKVAAHLDTCSACSVAHLTVDRVNQKLAAWLFPVVLWGIAGAKKGGLVWFAAGAGGVGAAGTPIAGGGGGGGSGAGPTPLVLGAAGVAVACAIAGGVALAVTAGDDETPRDDTSIAADPGGPGDAAPPPADRSDQPPDNQPQDQPSDTSTDAPTDGFTDAPPATEVPTSEVPTSDPPATPADPTPTESPTQTPTNPTSPNPTSPTPTSPNPTTPAPGPVEGGLVSVHVRPVPGGNPARGPFAVDVTSRVTGEEPATIQIRYTFGNGWLVKILRDHGDGWACGGLLDLIVLPGGSVTCTYSYAGTPPPPVSLQVTNLRLLPVKPHGVVTMTIDGTPAAPGEMGF